MWSTIALSLAWLTREALGRLVAKRDGQAMRIGFASLACGFFCRAMRQDGRESECAYEPDDLQPLQRELVFKATGDLYNDTNATVLYLRPALRFVGVDGRAVEHRAPLVEVNGVASGPIQVRTRERVRLTVSTTILRDALADYAQTVPVLDLATPSGQPASFRLSAGSFYGSPVVVWRRGKTRPVPVGTGRSDAGSLPSAAA